MKNDSLLQLAKKGQWETIIADQVYANELKNSLTEKERAEILWQAVGQENYDGIKFCLDNHMNYTNTEECLNHLYINAADIANIELFSNTEEYKSFKKIIEYDCAADAWGLSHDHKMCPLGEMCLHGWEMNNLGTVELHD